MIRRAPSPVLLATAGILAVLVAGCGREPEPADRGVPADSPAAVAEARRAPLDTVQPDSVVAVTSREATRDGELTITAVRYADINLRTYIVRADGRELHVEELATGAGIERVWERPAFQPDGSVALVSVDPGGNACMTQYHLVTLPTGQAPTITPAFGTCLPPDTIWATGAALRMRFPDYLPLAAVLAGDSAGPPTSWVYRRGRLEKEAP